jgi:glycylpeptide N-tetradecanoyltransferase
MFQCSLLVVRAEGAITDLVSYYTLPSTIIGNPHYDTLKAAFMYYTVAKGTPLLQLMTDALVLAHNKCVS